MEAWEQWGRLPPQVLSCGGKSSFCPHNIFPRDLNIKKLERQLQMLLELLVAYKTVKDIVHIRVTIVPTICEILTTVPMAREIFSEVDKLVRIYMTIPVTTTTVERSFSALRRIKTYLRSTMTEARLNNLMLLHAHTDLFDILILVTSLSSLFL